MEMEMDKKKKKKKGMDQLAPCHFPSTVPLFHPENLSSEQWSHIEDTSKLPSTGKIKDSNELKLAELSPTQYQINRSRHMHDTVMGLEGNSGRFEFSGESSSSSVENVEDVILVNNFYLNQACLVTATLFPDRIVMCKPDNSIDLAIEVEEMDKIGNKEEETTGRPIRRFDLLTMMCKLVHCSLSFLNTMLRVIQLGNKSWGVELSDESPKELRICEIYAVEHCKMDPIQQSILPFNNSRERRAKSIQLHQFSVHSFERSTRTKGKWVPRVYTFGHPDLNVCEQWVQQMTCMLESDVMRPRNLLVVVSPYSGRRRALKTWGKVSPLFKSARIQIEILQTERAKHAFDVIDKTTDAELQALDGIVVVGGDGLFNEVLNGLLLKRHKPKNPPRPRAINGQLHEGSEVLVDLANYRVKPGDLQEEELSTLYGLDYNTEFTSFPTADLHPLLHSSKFSSDDSNSSNTHAKSRSDACIGEAFRSSHMTDELTGRRTNDGVIFPGSKFRIGVIPAGSTDSIAVSVTGSRDPVTSALHIILGDSMRLDIARFVSWKSKAEEEDTEPSIRYAASFAGYGFYGDVIKESENYRWMGPMRYDFAGTKVFLKHKSYGAEVSYLDIPQVSFAPKGSRCYVNCAVCGHGIDYAHPDLSDKSSSHDVVRPRWKAVKGKFLCIGAAVMSNRNDKAPDGLSAEAHLADGLLHLILIKDCSHLAYLRHLLRLTRKGAQPLDFNFIEHYKTPEFAFVSNGKESIWNVDGEMLAAHELSAQVFRGLLPIFARGPEP